MRIAAVISTFALVTAPLAAHAQEAPREDVLTVVGLDAPDGDVGVASRLSTTLRAVAREDHRSVPDDTPTLAQEFAMVGCSTTDAECLAQIASDLHARQMLYGSVERTSREADTPLRVELGLWSSGSDRGPLMFTEALTAELRQTRPERAGALFLAIADRSDAAVLPVVLATAQGGAKNLQLLAIEAMIRDGKPACIPVLLDLLANHDVEVAKSAKSALGSWWSKEVDAQLTTRLAAASGSSRRWLLELAGQRHTTAALPELVRAARDGDATIRTAAVKALGDTVGVADLGVLTDLLAAARTDDERSVVQDALESACTRLEDKAGCAGKLIATLSAASSPVKCSLLRVLAAVPTPAALTAVQSALASSETSVRDAAVRVLADWPEAPALPAVLEVFRTTSDESHRFLALRGCVRLLDLGTEPAARAVETYRDLLGRTQRPDDRKVILSGLANVADVAALKLVEPLLAETEVRAEAEMAALKIATSIKKSAPAEAQAMATRLQSESKSETTRDGAAKLLKDLDKNR